MVETKVENVFKKKYVKLRNPLKSRLGKQLEKVIRNPKIGKPMMFARKGTREVYVPPFRLSYFYIEEENLIVFLDIYHKDIQ